MPKPQKPRSAVLLTGFPGTLGRRLAGRLLAGERSTDVYLLVQPKLLREARRFAAALPTGRANSVQLLAGDIVDMHLGLSGAEYRELVGRLTHIYHLAAVSFLSADAAHTNRVNIEGTRNLLELARDARGLRRFNHFSTCLVAGDRVGVVDEDELEAGQRFRNAYESSKYEAERLVRRAAGSLPVSIYRPSIVVGDSQTGEIDRLEGPYYLALQIAVSPLHIPLPLPHAPDTPLNVVPADFVADATFALAHDDRAVGKTFHLVDPNPMSTRRVYELLAARTQRKVRRLPLAVRAPEALFRFPALSRFFGSERAALAYGDQMVFYRCTNTLELLEGTGIRCPPPSTYLDTLIRFVREANRQKSEQVAEDPLDVTGEEHTLPSHEVRDERPA